MLYNEVLPLENIHSMQGWIQDEAKDAITPFKKRNIGF